MLLKRFAVSFLCVCTISMPRAALCQGVIGGFVSGSSQPITFGTQGITGLPYSGQMITTQVQTLADGTKITHISKSFQARDSQGRTRMESFLQEGTGADTSEPIFVTIRDPVTGQFIHLQPREKTAIVSTFSPPEVTAARANATQARRTQLVTSSQTQPQTGAGGGIGSGTAQSAVVSPMKRMPRPEVEKLPGQTINGIYAEGIRTTRIIPAGTQGNDRDITIVQETWFSPDLKIAVLTKTSDPRNGETTTEIKDLSRDEPSPELFQVPAGYKISSPQVE